MGHQLFLGVRKRSFNSHKYKIKYSCGGERKAVNVVHEKRTEGTNNCKEFIERVLMLDSLVVTTILEAVSIEMTNIFSSIDINLRVLLMIRKLTLIHFYFFIDVRPAR